MTKKIQQQLILVAIVFAAIIFVYFSYVLKPMKMKYTAAYDNLMKTESKLTEMKRRALQLPVLQAEMKQLEDEVTDLEKLLPKEKGIPELLRIITKTAQKHNVKITNFQPVKIVPKDNYNEVPFQITLQGTYHGLASFLAELGQETRILNTFNINYTAVAQSKESSATMNANFTLTAYTFKK